MKRIFHVQYTGLYTVSIDEQGQVIMQASAQRHLHDQDTVILTPEEAYNLLNFLAEHRDLLVKAITVRQEAHPWKEPDTDLMTAIQRTLPTAEAPVDGFEVMPVKRSELSSAD